MEELEAARGQALGHECVLGARPQDREATPFASGGVAGRRHRAIHQSRREHRRRETRDRLNGTHEVGHVCGRRRVCDLTTPSARRSYG